MKNMKVDVYVQLDDIKVGESKWAFKVFPNCKKKGADEAVENERVAVMCYSFNKEPKTAKISISVMENAENSSSTSIYKNRLIICSFPPQERDGTGTTTDYGWVFNKFLTHQDFPSNGVLHLFIKMTVFEAYQLRLPGDCHH